MKYFFGSTITVLFVLAGVSLRAQTGGSQRLISRSMYSSFQGGPFRFIDSFRYKYSASRGSDFHYVNLGYQDYFFPAVTSSFIDYDTQFHSRLDNAVMTYDTIYNAHNSAGRVTGTGKWNYYGVYELDALNRPTALHMINYSAFIPGFDTINRFFYTYNNAGQLSSNVCWKKTAGQWALLSLNEAEFNSSGFQVKNTFYIWSGTWQKTQRNLYTHYPSGSVQTNVSEVFDAVEGWVNQKKDSIIYSGSETADVYFSDDSAFHYWKTPLRIRRFLNAGQRPDSVHNAADGSRTYIVYNSSGNPVRKERIIGNGSSDVEYYYYEPAPVSVITVTGLHSLSIFPNPANESVTLTLGAGVIKTAARWTVSTMTGQTALTGAAEAGERFFTVSVAGLPPGQYAVRVSADDKLLSGTFVKF